MAAILKGGHFDSELLLTFVKGGVLGMRVANFAGPLLLKYST